MKYKKVLSIYFLLIFLFSGCSRNPLAPLGLIGFGVENKAFRTGLSPMLNSSKILPQYADNGDHELTVTVQKIEITTTGKEWVTIFVGDEEITATEVGGSYKVFGNIQLVKPDEYHGIRVWFGPKAKMKLDLSNIPFKYGEERLLETTRYDFNIGNPFDFTPENGLLNAPFTVRSNIELRIVLGFWISNIAGAMCLDDNWSKYRDKWLKESIVARTTRIE